MRLVITFTSLVLLAAGASAAPPALKPTPAAVRVPDRLASDPTSPALVNCTLGTSGPRSFLVDYLQLPDDSYFLFISPPLCGACGTAPGVWISSVKMSLEFRVPCSLPVEVAIVSPVADTACAAPRPPIVVGGPWPGVMSATSPGIKDFTLSLGHPSAVMHGSYLQVRFTGTNPVCNDPGTRPRLVTTASCQPCVAWNYYPADTADMCALLLPGTPLIWATVDSCVSASLVGVAPQHAGPRALQVSPNPARDGSDIAFTLSSPSHVRVSLHDVGGRRVRELLDAALTAGQHVVRWDGRDGHGQQVPPGTYFVVAWFGGQPSVRSVVFVR